MTVFRLSTYFISKISEYIVTEYRTWSW